MFGTKQRASTPPLLLTTTAAVTAANLLRNEMLFLRGGQGRERENGMEYQLFSYLPFLVSFSDGFLLL
jgi:hypothetical protein